jgi:hypothetical protein
MSKNLAKLKTDARQVEAIVADLRAVPSSASWDSLVPCSHTLPTGQDVEYWYLAEFFLSTWANWESRVGRYHKYFGQPPTIVPATWRSLREDCRELADHFWSKDRLDELLAESWQQSAGNEVKSDEIDPGGLYHEIIASHHRISICPPASNAGQWRRAVESATETDRAVRAKFDSASPTVQRQVRWHLSQYRHSMFDVSWLDTNRWKKPPSAYEYASRSSRYEPAWLGDMRGELTSEFAHKEEALRSVSRLATAIGEIGYYNFSDDAISDEMEHGRDSPLGTDVVQVIAPDAPAANESDFKLIVDRQSSSTNGMDLLGKTLDQFNGRTLSSFVIFITDSWDTPTFERRLVPRVQQAYENGHRFLFLLVGSPETCISRVQLALCVEAVFEEPDRYGQRSSGLRKINFSEEE